jgi:hypothetical protein
MSILWMQHSIPLTPWAAAYIAVPDMMPGG